MRVGHRQALDLTEATAERPWLLFCRRLLVRSLRHCQWSCSNDNVFSRPVRTMRLSEVFLRLGCALVAWMVLYTHLVWLATSRAIGCGPDGDAMYELLLGSAAFAWAFSFLLRSTRPLPEVHSILRWLGVPLAALYPFAAHGIWTVYSVVNLQGMPLCSMPPPPLWQRGWAAVETLALVLIAWRVVREWRAAGRPGAETA